MKKKIHCSVMKLMFLFFVVLSVSMVFCLTYMQQQKKEMLIDLSVGNSKETLNRYLLEFDSRLAELETYLYSFLYSTDALPAMETSQDEIALYYAKKQLSETLHEIVLLNSTVDGVWIYHPESQVFLLRNSYTGVTNQELTAVRDYVMNQLLSKKPSLLPKKADGFWLRRGRKFPFCGSCRSKTPTAAAGSVSPGCIRNFWTPGFLRRTKSYPSAPWKMIFLSAQIQRRSRQYPSMQPPSALIFVFRLH